MAHTCGRGKKSVSNVLSHASLYISSLINIASDGIFISVNWLKNVLRYLFSELFELFSIFTFTCYTTKTDFQTYRQIQMWMICSTSLHLQLMHLLYWKKFTNFKGSSLTQTSVLVFTAWLTGVYQSSTHFHYLVMPVNSFGALGCCSELSGFLICM